VHALRRVEKRHARLSAGSMEKLLAFPSNAESLLPKKDGKQVRNQRVAVGGCERGDGQSVVVIT
jgi:hypothetical protein